MIDRARAAHAFETYVDAYDANNPRIVLKVDHTYRVATLAERIAISQGLPESEVDLAWLLGLLHDIGRFEQVRRYDTFNDAASVSHAALGAQVLFEPYDTDDRQLVRAFLDSAEHDDLIRTAVACHSAYRLPDNLDERTRLHCDILRDADKIDILCVNCICPIQDIYGVSEAEMTASALTQECVDIFYQHRCLPRGVRVHPADIMLGHICFVWELVFPESVRIVHEQGYLAQMLSRTWTDPQTQASFDDMARHVHQELGI